MNQNIWRNFLMNLVFSVSDLCQLPKPTAAQKTRAGRTAATEQQSVLTPRARLHQAKPQIHMQTDGKYFGREGSKLSRSLCL